MKKNKAKTSPATPVEQTEETPPASPPPAAANVSNTPFIALTGVMIIAIVAVSVWAFYRQDKLKELGLNAAVAQVADLSHQVDVLTMQVDMLKEKITILETSSAKGDIREATIIMAVSFLKDTIDQGLPYRDNLALTQSLIPNSPQLAVLDRYADQGVSSLAMLISSFTQLSHRLDKEARMAAATEATGRVRSFIRSLVVIRKVDGTAVGNSLVSRVERYLMAGDLRAAVKELDTLNGHPHDTIGPWLAQAKQRLEVDTALSALAVSAAAAIKGTAP